MAMTESAIADLLNQSNRVLAALDWHADRGRMLAVYGAPLFLLFTLGVAAMVSDASSGWWGGFLSVIVALVASSLVGWLLLARAVIAINIAEGWRSRVYDLAGRHRAMLSGVGELVTQAHYSIMREGVFSRQPLVDRYARVSRATKES
jgi:hypothetical protein